VILSSREEKNFTMRLLRGSLALTLAASLALPSTLVTTAFAQSDEDRATARSLGQEGQDALDKKDFKTAEDRFRRADKLVHAPTLMLGLARALAGEGKFVEAQEGYNRMIREGVPPGAPEVFKKALDDAKAEVDKVAPKIGGVVINVTVSGGGDPSPAKVMLDEHPVNTASLGVKRLVDPGAHVLKVSLEGYRPVELKFNVPEGGSVNEPVTLEKEGARSTPTPTTTATTPPPPPTATTTVPPTGGGNGGTDQNPRPEQPTGGGRSLLLPIVAFGVGAAGFIAGSITGAIASSDHSNLQSKCTIQGSICPQSEKSDLEAYHTMAGISTVGFILGGAGAAAGVVLLIMRPKGEAPAPANAEPAKASLSPYIGTGSAGVVGTF
jgi:hypothetical protein